MANRITNRERRRPGVTPCENLLSALPPYLLVALSPPPCSLPAFAPLPSPSSGRKRRTRSRGGREGERDRWSGGGRQCGCTPRWSASTRRRGGATPPASSRGSSTSSGYVSLNQPPPISPFSHGGDGGVLIPSPPKHIR